MLLQLDDLAALDTPVQATGVPLMLAVDSIDEDPHQPRQEFDAATLEELAQTIRERGVRQPISVRKSEERSGRSVLNFGARRLRACRLAGSTEVPAFVDAAADSYDQVIENEQREGLKPMEIALFVQKRLAIGETQAEIARRLGKSRQYVTLATALIDAPAWLLRLYCEGRCQGLAELYELRKLYGQHAEEVERWCAERDSITRRCVANLKAELPTGPFAADTRPCRDESPARDASAVRAATKEADSRKVNAQRRRLSNPVVLVEMGGLPHALMVSVVPDLGDLAGHVFVQPHRGGLRRMVPAADLKLLGFANL